MKHLAGIFHLAHTYGGDALASPPWRTAAEIAESVSMLTNRPERLITNTNCIDPLLDGSIPIVDGECSVDEVGASHVLAAFTMLSAAAMMYSETRISVSRSILLLGVFIASRSLDRGEIAIRRGCGPAIADLLETSIQFRNASTTGAVQDLFCLYMAMPLLQSDHDRVSEFRASARATLRKPALEAPPGCFLPTPLSHREILRVLGLIQGESGL